MPRPIPPGELQGAHAPVLDVRDASAFAAGHLAGAGHVPFEELARTTWALPSRHQRLLVVGSDAAQALGAALRLESLGFGRVAYLDGAPGDAPGGLADRGPAARLWSPAPFLAEVAGRLPRGRALDVAAGACRNAVYLALNGFQAEAVDSDPAALERGRALAAREGVALRTWAQDLEAEPALPEERYQVVVCFRFLHRPLFAALQRTLAHGGHLVYETYRVGRVPPRRPRKPRFLLAPGELEAAFQGLEVLHHSEPEADDGTATARLWARRPLDLAPAATRGR
jgi:SAM-dependent methyltransferase